MLKSSMYEHITIYFELFVLNACVNACYILLNLLFLLCFHPGYHVTFHSIKPAVHFQFCL